MKTEKLDKAFANQIKPLILSKLMHCCRKRLSLLKGIKRIFDNLIMQNTDHNYHKKKSQLYIIIGTFKLNISRVYFPPETFLAAEDFFSISNSSFASPSSSGLYIL